MAWRTHLGENDANIAASSNIDLNSQQDFSGNKTNGLSSSDSYGLGLQTVNLISQMWTGYQSLKVQRENNRLQKEAFEFNKDMSLKNFNLAKEDHDRKVRRSNSISRQYANSSKKWKNINNNRKHTQSPSIAQENARRQRMNSQGV